MIVSDPQKKGMEISMKWRLYGWNCSQLSKKFFPSFLLLSIGSTVEENLDFSKRISAAPNWFVCVAKALGCYDSQSNNFKLSSKGLNKWTLEDSGDGPISKYNKISDQVFKVTSAKCFSYYTTCCWNIWANKEGNVIFYPNKNVQQDGTHTRPNKRKL